MRAIESSTAMPQCGHPVGPSGAAFGRPRRGRLRPMPAAAPDLQVPSLLIALPQVLDPFFRKSVVLLIHHSEEGSLGLIVNRPTGIPVRDILEGMEIEWGGAAAEMTHFGGPVQPQLGTVLFSPAGLEARKGNGDGVGEDRPTAASDIAAGISLTQHIGDLGRLAASPPERFRLFLGYAGWGEGQLLEEILRNDWLTAPVTSDLVFSPDPEGAWDGALRSVGVDPGTLPSWTLQAGTDDGDAN